MLWIKCICMHRFVLQILCFCCCCWQCCKMMSEQPILIMTPKFIHVNTLVNISMYVLMVETKPSDAVCCSCFLFTLSIGVISFIFSFCLGEYGEDCSKVIVFVLCSFDTIGWMLVWMNVGSSSSVHQRLLSTNVCWNETIISFSRRDLVYIGVCTPS